MWYHPITNICHFPGYIHYNLNWPSLQTCCQKLEENFSYLLYEQEIEIEFVFSHGQIQDSVAELFQAHTWFFILVSQLVTGNGELTNWWVQTEVYPKMDETTYFNKISCDT
jgi:hypothetical protein